jgi:hypothetical protein
MQSSLKNVAIRTAVVGLIVTMFESVFESTIITEDETAAYTQP